MKKTKKEILSLLLTGTLVISASGCKNNSIIRKVDNNKNVTYVGSINDEAVSRLSIIEIEKTDTNKDIYLTYNPNNVDYYLLGTDTILVNKKEESKESISRGYYLSVLYLSDYGIVTNVYEFKQFIPIYSVVKDTYSADDIIEVFNKVKEDYDELTNKPNIKKLELIRE